MIPLPITSEQDPEILKLLHLGQVLSSLLGLDTLYKQMFELASLVVMALVYLATQTSLDTSETDCFTWKLKHIFTQQSPPDRDLNMWW